MRRWFLPLLFLSAALFTAPASLRTLRDAVALAPLSMEERRERVLGEDYIFSRDLGRVLPLDAEVAIFAADYGGPIDRAIFVNYYLYPRRTEFHIRQLSTAAARSTVVVPLSGPMRRTFVIDPKPYSAPLRTFVIPFVAAIDALDPYCTELVIEAERDAEVTLTLFPAGTAKTHRLRAGEPMIIGDVLVHGFGSKGVGWLRVEATQPVRAGAWFVNRGGAQSWPMAILERLPELPQTIAGGEKLWILNAGDTPAAFVAEGIVEDTIGPREIVSYPALERNAVRGEGPLFAFTSGKLPDGNTRFAWPEGVR